MAHNRYFIINAEDPNMDEIAHVIVGSMYTQRYSIDGTMLVVKLHQGDHSDYEFLADYTEYDHDAILEQLHTLEWTSVL